MKTVNEVAMENDSAYNSLTTLLCEAATLEADLVEAQTALTNARTQFILTIEPADLGKNEQQREAKLASLTSAELRDVQRLENRKAVLKFQIETARLRVQQVNSDLRLLELACGLRDNRFAA